MKTHRFAAAALSLALACAAVPAAPALADGAASTRNILFGAAAVGGTLLILNHNKKVHEKYAEKDQAVAAEAADANDQHAAYLSERRAYENETAAVREYQGDIVSYKRTVAAQHREIAALRREVAQSRASSAVVAQGRTTPARANGRPVQTVAYGWGAL